MPEATMVRSPVSRNHDKDAHPTGTAAVSWVAMAWKALEETDLEVSSRAMGWPSLRALWTSEGH